MDGVAQKASKLPDVKYAALRHSPRGLLVKLPTFGSFQLDTKLPDGGWG